MHQIPLVVSLLAIALGSCSLISYYCCVYEKNAFKRHGAPIKHLALIMDGNRRWAKEKGLETLVGHKEGGKVAQSFMQYCLERKIEYLSLYVFSTENFNRSAQEKEYLFSMVAKQAHEMLPMLHENKVSVRFIGDRSLFPQSVSDVCTQVESETASYSDLVVNLLFCYGGRAEILNGVRECVGRVQQGQATLDDINEDFFKSCLWTGNIPDPEIVIRTGDRSRLSNFLLFQVAYSELYFLDMMWPDLLAEKVDEILNDYVGRQRNFGV